MTVPVPDISANVIGWSGIGLSNWSMSSALSVLRWLPPSQVGLLVSRSTDAGPGVIVIALLTAGALPASSRATITIGSTEL